MEADTGLIPKLGSCILGDNMVLGNSFADGTFRMLMEIGPLPARRMESFFPGAIDCQILNALAELFLLRQGDTDPLHHPTGRCPVQTGDPRRTRRLSGHQHLFINTKIILYETEKQHRSKESLFEVRRLSDVLHHPCGNHLCLFLKTSGIEVKRITEQALEYDHIYAKELSLSNSVDSVYQYMKLMNTSPRSTTCSCKALSVHAR